MKVNLFISQPRAKQKRGFFRKKRNSEGYVLPDYSEVYEEYTGEKFPKSISFYDLDLPVIPDPEDRIVVHSFVNGQLVRLHCRILGHNLYNEPVREFCAKVKMDKLREMIAKEESVTGPDKIALKADLFDKANMDVRLMAECLWVSPIDVNSETQY